VGGLTAVVDAALVVDAFSGGRPRHAEAVRLLRSPVAVPALIDIEVASAFRRLVRHRRLDATTAETSLLVLAAHSLISRHPYERHLPRVWQLREAMSPYDAVYVALAEALGIPSRPPTRGSPGPPPPTATSTRSAGRRVPRLAA